MPAVEKNQSTERPADAALRKNDLEGVNIHVCTLSASGATPQGVKYKDIYVHSKLLLVDDVFFTLGSANVNVRSMEGDSELNIACPSPELTKRWRRDLWRLHTGRTPSDDMGTEYELWRRLLDNNSQSRSRGEALSASLIEFFDGEAASFAPD